MQLISAATRPSVPGMNRRRFLLTSLAAAVAPPISAEAQPAGRVPRVGYVASSARRREINRRRP